MRALPAKIAGRLASVAPSMESVWSRHQLRIDDDCVRLRAAAGHLPMKAAIARASDVAAALTVVESVLEAAIPRSRRRGFHRVEIVVSGGFACYFILPWVPLPRPVDWLASARTKFVLDGLGAPESWRFNVEDGPWGSARMAAAVPEALCAGIERMCKAQKLRLGRIEPAFLREVHHHRAKVYDGSIAIVEIEERGGRRSVAHIGFRHHKQWVGYVALPAVAPIGHVLRDAALLCRVAPVQRIHLIAPAQMQAVVGGLPGAQWLPSLAGDVP